MQVKILSNCWDTLKQTELQHDDEIYVCVNCGEIRKNQFDGIWLNPKCYYNGKSAAKPRTEEGSTTRALCS